MTGALEEVVASARLRDQLWQSLGKIADGCATTRLDRDGSMPLSRRSCRSSVCSSLVCPALAARARPAALIARAPSRRDRRRDQLLQPLGAAVRARGNRRRADQQLESAAALLTVCNRKLACKSSSERRMNTYIKSTQDGRRVEVIGTCVCLGRRPEADKLVAVIEHPRWRAILQVAPDATHMAGRVALTVDEARKSRARAERRARAPCRLAVRRRWRSARASRSIAC